MYFLKNKAKDIYLFLKKGGKSFAPFNYEGVYKKVKESHKYKPTLPASCRPTSLPRLLPTI
jgi:hypothetical protein